MNNSDSARPKPKLLPKPGLVKVVKALYSYEARTTEELSFEEGDVLYVFEQNADGWWKAKHKGRFGLIPYNYVSGESEVKEPMHDAARRGNITFLEDYLSQGVSSTALDAMGNTPLYWASHSGHLDCVEALLKSNPKQSPINVQNVLGDTPLHGAASKDHVQVVELLLSAGADATLKNSDGDTPESLTSDLAVKNLLQLSHYNRRSISVNFDDEEYEDDSV